MKLGVEEEERKNYWKKSYLKMNLMKMSYLKKESVKLGVMEEPQQRSY
jgi:hypothetical protein